MNTSPLAQLIAAFKTTFNAEPTLMVRAPGRVNLLGEHVDYNGGWVLPVAIDRATYLVARPISDEVHLLALDLNAQQRFALTGLAAKRAADGEPLSSWAKYPAGTAWALAEAGWAVGGLQVAYASDVPRGAGLSSSASVEVAFATAWQMAGGWALDALDKARLCQRAENQYVGVNCGLMDQFASACGRANHALLLDCRSLDWQTVPLPTDAVIVVADTSVRRELGKSEYNLRRAHCEEAVRGLADVLPGIQTLREVPVEDFNRHVGRLTPIVAQRARHVVEECARTLSAVEALRANDVRRFGQLMNACHTSLRDLYEVSCPELNAMVNTAQHLDGCYGARLTGAGFGGCTVNLVAASAAEQFKKELAAHYTQATGKTAEIYVCQAAEGAGVVTL